MKKQMLKSALIALAGVGLMSGVALADEVYTDNPADYWTLTDFTTGVSGDSLFMITLEEAGYESDFGIFLKNADGTLGTKFEIFDGSDEVLETATVSFNSSFQVTLDNPNDPDADWTSFGSIFGFYFDVLDSGESYYTASQFNTTDVDIEHVKTYWNGISTLKIALEDLPESTWSGSEPDYNDMVVIGTDLKPVPEPATMLLFGTGLAGIAGFARRKAAQK